MKSIILIITVTFVLVACEKSSNGEKIKSGDGEVRRFTSEVLTPKDLGIQKECFAASPSSDQVAIFRVEHINRLNPKRHKIYDQIFWEKNGREVVVDVVIVPLSFYVGTPEIAKSSPETFDRDSWNLRAGIYSQVITEYSFLGSSFGSGGSNFSVQGLGMDAKIGTSHARGEIAYTKNIKTESKDLEFKFMMFVVSLEDAKKMHPKLDIDPDETTSSWKAAYFYKPRKTEQDGLLTADPSRVGRF